MKKGLTRTIVSTATVLALTFAVSAAEQNSTQSTEKQENACIAPAAQSNVNMSCNKAADKKARCESAVLDCQKAIDALQKKLETAKQKNDSKLVDALTNQLRQNRTSLTDSNRSVKQTKLALTLARLSKNAEEWMRNWLKYAVTRQNRSQGFI